MLKFINILFLSFVLIGVITGQTPDQNKPSGSPLTSAVTNEPKPSPSPSEISTVTSYCKDLGIGRRLRGTTRCFDLQSGRKKRCGGNYAQYDAEVFRKVQQLPNYRLMKKSGHSHH